MLYNGIKNGGMDVTNKILLTVDNTMDKDMDALHIWFADVFPVLKT